MTCKKCGGTGWQQTTDENGHITARKCDCMNEENIAILLTNSHIPKGYIDKTVNDYIVTDDVAKALKSKAIEYVEIFKKDKVDGLYIYSKAKGCGKSHCACAMGIALIKRQMIMTRFTTLSDLLLELKSSLGYDTEINTLKVLEKYRTTDLLILDDLGVEKVSEWAEEMVYNIVDFRDKNVLPTIYTSNCKIEDLKYSDRIKSRIKGNTISIQAPNEDRRGI